MLGGPVSSFFDEVEVEVKVDVLVLLPWYYGIEEHHRCFGLGGYFMATVLAAASYSRIGFSLHFAVRARRVRVPGGSSSTCNQE